MEVELIPGEKELRTDDVTDLEAVVITDDVTRTEREDSIIL